MPLPRVREALQIRQGLISNRICRGNSLSSPFRRFAPLQRLADDLIFYGEAAYSRPLGGMQVRDHSIVTTTRFEDETPPALYVAILLSTVAVLFADLYTPLGVAVWVAYMIPVVLSFWTWRPELPLGVGLAATALIVLTFFTDTEGMNREISQINRGFGVLTVWVTAVAGWQFIRAKLAVRKAEWLQTGQTGLSGRLMGEQRLDEVADNAIRFLCNYLEAQAGAIYVEDGGAFRRCATFAAPAQGVPERFAPGEGLLGQAAKEKQPFVLSDLPEDYLLIGSGLGRARPRHLLVAPFGVDNRVTVLVELGFFRPVFQTDKELLSRVSESVAVAIRSAVYRMRLQNLLEETQRQSEELQSQSEELRASNEELEEQSRALTESRNRLQQQQSELVQTNEQLAKQTQLLETQRDELKKKQRTLEEQAAALAKASRYKSDFLANMSHELRTPLNSALILANLLAENREGNLTEDQVKYAQTIHSSGVDLLALINDVLDLSKVEAGLLKVRLEQVSLEDVLEGLRRRFSPVAARKNLNLRLHSDAGAPESLETDPLRLEQILNNLVSNALKFTAKGEVSLEVSRAGDDRVAFVVRDTGIGIEPDKQKVVFEPFCQADDTTVRRFGGTGLGLSISRELADLLGGSIELASEPGHGSTFTLTVPVEFPDERALQSRGRNSPPNYTAATPASICEGENTPHSTPLAPIASMPDDRNRLTGRKQVILIAEDDLAFARVVADGVHELGFQCLVATGAQEALALAKEHLPNAVILEVVLPDASGLVVLERLKCDAHTRHIPVYVISGSNQSVTAMAMGAAGFLLTPVWREELLDALRKLEVQITQKMRRVLVVEDDPAQLESLQLLLSSSRVETVGARTAAECFEKLQTSTFDCMVLDLTLPDSSGLDILEKLGSQEGDTYPPVVIYTGRELTLDEEQRLRRYAKSVIVKGAMSPERLLEEVTLYLHQAVSDLTTEQQCMLEKARNRDAALEGRRILVVEDDMRNIYALSACLEPLGVKVDLAFNGRQALEALEQSQARDGRMVDLVLMDIMMPEMDGLTAMREVRKRPEWRKLPIIALTAKAMRQDQENCLQAGANDYLTKPLDIEQLLSLIRVWIPR